MLDDTRLKIMLQEQVEAVGAFKGNNPSWRNHPDFNYGQPNAAKSEPACCPTTAIAPTLFTSSIYASASSRALHYPATEESRGNFKPIHANTVSN